MISPKFLALPIRQNQEDTSSSPPYPSTSPNITSSSNNKSFTFIPRPIDTIHLQPKATTPSENIQTKMTNFSIAAIMNNSGTPNREMVGESGDLNSLTSISDPGMALANRIQQHQLTSLREHAFLQLGRKGFDDSTLSPLSTSIDLMTLVGYKKVASLTIKMSPLTPEHTIYTCIKYYAI